ERRHGRAVQEEELGTAHVGRPWHSPDGKGPPDVLCERMPVLREVKAGKPVHPPGEVEVDLDGDPGVELVRPVGRSLEVGIVRGPLGGLTDHREPRAPHRGEGVGADLECLHVLLPAVGSDSSWIEDPRGLDPVAYREVDIEAVLVLHVACPFYWRVCAALCHSWGPVPRPDT